MVKYKLREIITGIFWVEFENKFDLAMTFLRYQEYYESANPKFKKKRFTIIDFIEWYSKQNGDVFTYPDDWAGFNIPGRVFYEVQRNHSGLGPILDYNKYDDVMNDIVGGCDSKTKDYMSFYIIGTLKGDVHTLKHEVAHGLYSTCEPYKKAMDEAYLNLPEKSKKILNTYFENMGYHQSVWKDESQACLSTDKNYLNHSERKLFVKIFDEFTKTIKWNHSRKTKN